MEIRENSEEISSVALLSPACLELLTITDREFGNLFLREYAMDNASTCKVDFINEITIVKFNQLVVKNF